MMMKALLLALLCVVGTVAQAAQPKVVETQPKNGDRNVNPRLRRLRVVFDQPMDHGGHSFVGGGDAFPKVTGKARWLDDRTCVLPVRLEAEHEYKLGINSRRFQNFRSADGEAAVPYELSFRTAPGGDMPDVLTEGENREAVAELRSAIDLEYSHRDLHGVDWKRVFDDAEPKLLAARTPQEFAAVAAEALKAANDLHLWFEADDRVFATTKRSVKPNFDLAVLRQSVPGWSQKAPALFVGRFDDGIAYLLITSWDRGRLKDLQPLFRAIEEAGEAPGLIVDVRANSGGDELLARQFSGCFLKSPKVYAQHIIRSEGKFLEVTDRIVVPDPKRPAFHGPVAVLMGPANMSSCESFLLMMKQVPDCKLIGERSYGSSGNPQPIGLANGVTIYLPSWRDLLPDGTCFEGQGIEPDLEVKSDDVSAASADAVLEAALRELRQP